MDFFIGMVLWVRFDTRVGYKEGVWKSPRVLTKVKIVATYLAGCYLNYNFEVI